DFGAIALAAYATRSGAVAAPSWWDPSWFGLAALVAVVLNGIAVPSRAAIVAAVAGALVGWSAGHPLPALAAGLAIALMAVALEPLRRLSDERSAAGLPAGLARANGQAGLPALAVDPGDSTPVGEDDLRAAAAMLNVATIILLVQDSSRRRRTPSGELHSLQDGAYRVQRVSLDPDSAEQAGGLGFFPPPGLHLPPPRRVKPLHGQAGELGRIVLAGGLPAPAQPQSKQATTQDALLAVLAALWSLRLDNRRLAVEAESRLLDIVESLVTSVEAKDPYTSGHSKRVCRYSLLIAEALGVTGRELEEIGIGAALHDVGKLGIPEQVLSKPAKLDPAEWELMKSHPKTGAKIIDSFNQSTTVLHIIFHHHERYDGRGYPAGLQGDAIPFPARIVAVADALDAMTSQRSYQANRTILDALQEVRRNTGAQFDPQVVDALLRLPLHKLEEIAPKAPAPAPGAAPLSAPPAPRPEPRGVAVAAAG
ncbi:MAG: HD-GYP domain-containing protein, partial [Chloroflexota bacterium]